jgi:predicted nucleic acid-binding protein
MADHLTAKILDATTISVSLGEIRTIDLIEVASRYYPLYTTVPVKKEIEVKFPREAVEEAFHRIQLRTFTPQGGPEPLARLQSSFPYLHDGELSTFLLAILEYELKGDPYYFITDDLRMRKTITRILDSKDFIELVGKKLPGVSITGTVGLIRRLYQIGGLTKWEIHGIIKDLGDSTFHLKPEVLEHLRRLVDED